VKVADAEGKVLREINGPTAAGLHRLNWDLRPTPPGGQGPRPGGPGGGPGRGGAAPLVKPGRYTVTLAKVVGGATTPLGEPQAFEVVPLEQSPATDAKPAITIQE
jgi:hypothetical protein